MRVFDKAGDLLDYTLDTDIFLVDPWIPAKSTIILFGKPSTGKTPVAWAMAEAVQTGGMVLGVPAKQGNALVFELDMPDVIVYKRLRDGNLRPNFTLVLEENQIDSPQLLDERYCDRRHREIRGELRELNKMYRPSFVVIDALREVVRGDLNGTGIADGVYAAWHSMFPEASILFVHHEPKDHYDWAGKPMGSDLEKAKGSQEFVDIAQVGIRLVESNTGRFLVMAKSQASERPPPMKIKLTGGLLTGRR